MTKDTLKKAKQVLGKIDHELPEASKLMRNASHLTQDVKKKADSLNFLFRPLELLNKRSAKKPRRSRKRAGKFDRVLDYAEEAIGIFKEFQGK